jgi:hypothetical protein
LPSPKQLEGGFDDGGYAGAFAPCALLILLATYLTTTQIAQARLRDTIDREHGELRQVLRQSGAGAGAAAVRERDRARGQRPGPAAFRGPRIAQRRHADAADD